MSKFAKWFQFVIPVGAAFLVSFFLPRGLAIFQLVILLYVLLFTLVLIQLLLTSRRSAAPTVVPLAYEKIPPEVCDYFDSNAARLAPLGFRMAADVVHLEILGAAAGASHCRLLKNDLQKDMALLVC